MHTRVAHMRVWLKLSGTERIRSIYIALNW